jgi:energy-coupling factor transporter ATP-binding protein EcfA2
MLIHLFSRTLDAHDIADGAKSVRLFRSELSGSAVRGLSAMRKSAGQSLRAEFAPIMTHEPLIRLLFDGVRFLKACEETGLPVCFPDIVRIEEDRFSVCGLYNPILHRKLMKTGRGAAPIDIELNPGGEMCFLTGANKSGKTTTLQAVAAAQLLFQSGYPIPAKRAALSPAPRIEALVTNGESSDLERAKTCLSALPEHSLLLCNELFSTMPRLREAKTSASFLHALCIRRARGFFVTHNFLLTSLFGNPGIFGESAVGSFVLPLDARGNPEYRVERRPPEKESHAASAARSVGVDFQALREEFEREFKPEDPAYRESLRVQN